ncbi:hypothetical protein Pfo_000430 [Paulownia fortunei]|nr:hypothetical protein Pfo_000430 [Paulownia fortunei]
MYLLLITFDYLFNICVIRLSFPVIFIIPILSLWYIWCSRNDKKHRGVPFRYQRIISRIMDHIFSTQKANLLGIYFWKGDLRIAEQRHFTIPKVLRLSVKQVRWQFPDSGWFKLTTYGAAKGNPDLVGAGGLLQNSTGHLIFAFYDFLGSNTNTYVELQAVASGLARCFEKGI